MQLFVKNVPLNHSMEDVKKLFESFGTVISVVPVPDRKTVVYVVRNKHVYMHSAICNSCHVYSTWILRVLS